MHYGGLTSSTNGTWSLRPGPTQSWYHPTLRRNVEIVHDSGMNV